MRYFVHLCIFCLLLLSVASFAAGQRRDAAKHLPAAQLAQNADRVPVPAAPQSSEDPEKLRWEIEKLKAETALSVQIYSDPGGLMFGRSSWPFWAYSSR